MPFVKVLVHSLGLLGLRLPLALTFLEVPLQEDISIAEFQRLNCELASVGLLSGFANARLTLLD